MSHDEFVAVAVLTVVVLVIAVAALDVGILRAIQGWHRQVNGLRTQVHDQARTITEMQRRLALQEVFVNELRARAGLVDAEPLDAEPLDAEPLDAEPLDRFAVPRWVDVDAYDKHFEDE